MMKTSSLSHSLDQVLGPLQDSMSPEFKRTLAQYRVNAKFQKQLDHLAKKNTEGKLTPEEKREYRNHLSALKVITILRVQARRQLAESK
jgi:hypothetical protein